MSVEHQNSLQAFDATYAALFGLLADYPAVRRNQSGACGHWSPRQVLAHLSGWIVEAERRYDNYAAGDKQPVRYDFDEFNAKSVEARVALDWDATVAKLETLYRAYSARAVGLSAEQMADERHRNWLDALDEDCREHSEQLHSFAGV